MLARDAWGQGFATEALTAVLDVARQIGVARVHALCHPQHRASWRVLEKCGFVHDTSRSKQAEFPNLAPGQLQDARRYEIVLQPASAGAGSLILWQEQAGETHGQQAPRRSSGGWFQREVGLGQRGPRSRDIRVAGGRRE